MNTSKTSTAPTASRNIPNQRKQKILVVGATGFLGAKILSQLARDETIALRAMSRRGAPADATAAVEWVRGDLMDSASLDAALKGVDVVVSSANGYMKETIEADFQGNKNLIEAAARAGVNRFVFLSIVACETASAVPHFLAKKVAEDLIRASGLPYVFVRAPAFLDQSADYVADGVRSGRFYVVGDKATKWSYVLTDDLATAIAKAATYPGEEIINQTIDIGWRDGAKSQKEMAALILQVTGKPLSLWVVPWMVFSVLVRLVKPFSELGYDLIQMFLFFRTGKFVSDTTKQEHFFGPAPTAREAIDKWAASNKLKP
ncbi:MAG: SDR family oxidoreductase [Comamonadaceae bacterium]